MPRATARRLRPAATSTADAPSLTSRFARPWTSADARVPPPEARDLAASLAAGAVPPPVAARLIAAVALHAPEDARAKAVAEALPALPPWPTVLAAATLPHAALDTLVSAPAARLVADRVAELSTLTVSADALSPAAANATPLERVDLGISADPRARIPRVVQYSLDASISPELDYLVTLAVKPAPKPAPKPTTPTPKRHMHASKRSVRRASYRPDDPLATFTLGRSKTSFGSPRSSRRSAVPLPPRSPNVHRLVQNASAMQPRKTGDLLLDEQPETAAATRRSAKSILSPSATTPENPPRPENVPHDPPALNLYSNHSHDPLMNDIPMHADPQEQDPLLSLDPQPDAPHDDQPEDVLLVDQEAKEEEEMIDLVEAEEKPSIPQQVDDEVIEIGPDGEEIPPPLKEKKRPSLSNFLSKLRTAKEDNSRKKIHLVPIDEKTPLTDLPPAQDTAFARREKLKEKKAKRQDKEKQAKQSRKAQEARNQERRKLFTERKKKAAATLKEEATVYDDQGEEEEEEDANEIDTSTTNAIDIDGDEPSRSPSNSRPRSPNRIPHYPRKRQRMGQLDAPTGPNGQSSPFPQDSRFYPNGPPQDWHQSKGHEAPNGAANGSYHPPFPRPGRGPMPPYPPPPPPHDRFSQQYPPYPPHPHTPYPLPHQGHMPYPPHSQYPPHGYGAPYHAPGYPPHGQPLPYPMYNHQQYGPPPYSGPAQAPFRPPDQLAKRERLPERLFTQKRKQLYNTIGSERKDLSPEDERVIDDFLDNQIYMFQPDEEQKDLVLDVRPGTRTILRIHKSDGVWAVVKLRDD